ncbi:hypothetical protein LJC68_00440 [Bacteroidales bacterium OttesenSCG-928-B11]|nr:hypothetical protein [Bacteroidales bacterium OttesenSCG-928-E04]MDL2311333.1 hypothetical protein [Bacteroidales bacterium OttesenSCG-928-B11]
MLWHFAKGEAKIMFPAKRQAPFSAKLSYEARLCDHHPLCRFPRLIVCLDFRREKSDGNKASEHTLSLDKNIRFGIFEIQILQFVEMQSYCQFKSKNDSMHFVIRQLQEKPKY